MPFGCSGKEIEKFQNKTLNTKRVRVKKSKRVPTNHTEKVTHKRYFKIDPQLLLKK